MERWDEILPLTDDRWQEVVQSVLHSGLFPHDSLQVAAMLEMAGWSDARARSEFGYLDVFTMATALYRQVRARTPAPIYSPPPQERPPFFTWLKHCAGWFLRGLLPAMPIVSSFFGLVLVRAVPGSDDRTPGGYVTGMAIATMGSYLLTGGLSQAIARRGLFFIGLKEFLLARKSSLILLGAGMGWVVLVAGAVTLVNAIWPFASWRLIGFVAPLFLFLALLWLSATVLYMVKKEILFTLVHATGLGSLWYLSVRQQWLPVTGGQLLTLGYTALICFAAAVWFLRRQERHSGAGKGTILPPWPHAVRQLLPFFLFGTLFAAYLFLDRGIAWALVAKGSDLSGWLMGDYEMGVGSATLSLVIPLGFVEVSMNLFARRIESEYLGVSGSEWQPFNRRLRRAFLLHVAGLALSSALSVALLPTGLDLLSAAHLLEQGLYDSPVTRYVSLMGAMGFQFLVAGLHHCLILFSLNRPGPAVTSMAAAVAVDLVAGTVAAQTFGYAEAVVGMVIGAFTLAAISFAQVRKHLTRLDYLLYRSL